MKKIWISVILLLIVCANICGCENKDNTGIPPLEEVVQMGQWQAAECLTGYSKADLAAAWGEPDLWPFGVVGDWWHYGRYGGEVRVTYGPSADFDQEEYSADSYIVTSVSISPDIYTTGLSASDRKVDEFLEQLGSYDTGYTDDVCYNVSTEGLADYGFEVFKFEKSRISFLMFDGEIYELADGFGFEGITYFAVADLNQDGHGELYFTNMAGSGNPYLEAGYFDTAVKETTVFDTVFHNSPPLYMEGGYVYGEGGTIQYETIHLYAGDFDIHSSVEIELNISDNQQCMGAIEYDGSRFLLNECKTSGYIEEKDVVILPDESFLSDFEVIGNEVHIYCVVSLENHGSDSKTIKLSGDFQNEVSTGLLTTNILEAHFIDENTDTITLEGNSDAKYVEIEFVGKYAGTSVMSSKALPRITVLSEE